MVLLVTVTKSLLGYYLAGLWSPQSRGTQALQDGHFSKVQAHQSLAQHSTSLSLSMPAAVCYEIMSHALPQLPEGSSR